ncbi:MAG: DnaJ family domain-containing protein [Nitrospirota bacterium]
MDIFSTIAERKILDALEQGEFDDLPGKGKPLVFEDETWIPEDLRAVYRILKNSGYVPPELELRNEIINLKSLISTIDDDQERLRKLRELNFKMMHLEVLRKRPLNLGCFPEYESRVIDRLTSS